MSERDSDYAILHRRTGLDVRFRPEADIRAMFIGSRFPVLNGPKIPRQVTVTPGPGSQRMGKSCGAVRPGVARPGLQALPAIQAQPGLKEGLVSLGG